MELLVLVHALQELILIQLLKLVKLVLQIVRLAHQQLLLVHHAHLQAQTSTCITINATLTALLELI